MLKEEILTVERGAHTVDRYLGDDSL